MTTETNMIQSMWEEVAATASIYSLNAEKKHLEQVIKNHDKDVYLQKNASPIHINEIPEHVRFNIDLGMTNGDYGFSSKERETTFNLACHRLQIVDRHISCYTDITSTFQTTRMQ